MDTIQKWTWEQYARMLKINNPELANEIDRFIDVGAKLPHIVSAARLGSIMGGAGANSQTAAMVEGYARVELARRFPDEVLPDEV